MDPELKDELAQMLRGEFGWVKTEFVRVHERLDSVDQRLDSVDQRLDAHDRQFVSLHDQLDRLTRGVAQQFETQQKYMDRRFNEVLESLDFRHGNHERRIKRLEQEVFGSN